MGNAGSIRRGVHPSALPPGADADRGYSYGVQVGRLLWVSGQVPMNTAGEIVGKGDIEAQTVQVFENLKAVVEETGGTLDDVVKISTFVSDVSFREPVQAVRRRYFPGPLKPASATVAVEILVPDVLVEIDAVAVLQGADTDEMG